MAVIEDFGQTDPNDPEFIFWCPGCKCEHWFKTTGDRPRWTWNGNRELPTISPSIVNSIKMTIGGTKTRCHLFIRDGQIQYLGDCAHHLAGKTVSMVPIPD